MDRTQFVEHSPLGILGTDSLKSGEVGAVTARAGVGKTAFLVQVGLQHLVAEERVLHIALGGETVNRVRAWYDTLLEDLANVLEIEDRQGLKSKIERSRLIQSYGEAKVRPAQIERTLELYATHLDFSPSVIIIDGFDWDGDLVRTAASLGALRSCAARMNAKLWFSIRCHRDTPVTHALGISSPCDAYADLLEVVLDLVPMKDHTSLRLLKKRASAPEGQLNLQSDTMRLLRVGGKRSTVSLPAGVCTLLSGAASGSEQLFGECAERWGLAEINYTFKGRPSSRIRGVVQLSDEQLKQGHVTSKYLSQHMHRNFPDTPLFKKVLQSIWHQVNTANQVFVVGMILEDGTVKGGTGWAAELGKHFNKELHVFDQEKGSWFTWEDSKWTAQDDTPRITSRRFTGTGSRVLSDQGREAIEALFTDSFGTIENN
jgi:hypothetical protein